MRRADPAWVDKAQLELAVGLHITAGNGGLNAAMRFASRYVHVVLKLPPRNP